MQNFRSSLGIYGYYYPESRLHHTRIKTYTYMIYPKFLYLDAALMPLLKTYDPVLCCIMVYEITCSSTYIIHFPCQ
jgi:hypothetical protein